MNIRKTTLSIIFVITTFTLYGAPKTENTISTMPSKIEMVELKGGKYKMGYNEGEENESPEHEVTITPFLIGKYEITYGQWKYIYNWAIENGYEFDNKGQPGAMYEAARALEEGDNPYTGTDDYTHPVLMINWYDVIKWCNAKSEMEGLEVVYYTDSSKKNIYRKGRADIMPTMVNWRANGYRLPTEAEWEYAARGGTESVYYWGNNEKESGKYANLLDETVAENFEIDMYVNSRDGFIDTAKVGSLMPNKFNLHDMIGNAWEWVFDYYGDYNSGNIKDPKGPAKGDRRVIRGGGFYTNYPVMVTTRFGDNPYTSDYSNGFRIARNK